jgi:hypothetical protein
VCTNLQLLEHEVLRDLSRLVPEIRFLIRPPRSRGQYQPCRQRAHESESQRSRPDRDEPPHQASET